MSQDSAISLLNSPVRNDPEHIAAQLIVMFTAFGAVVSEQRLAVYVEMLLDIPPDRLEHAIVRCMQECEFPPTIAAIRQRYQEDRAILRPDLSEHDVDARRVWWQDEAGRAYKLEQESPQERSLRLRRTEKWKSRYEH